MTRATGQRMRPTSHTGGQCRPRLTWISRGAATTYLQRSRQRKSSWSVCDQHHKQALRCAQNTASTYGTFLAPSIALATSAWRPPSMVPAGPPTKGNPTAGGSTLVRGDWSAGRQTRAGGERSRGSR
jgi:hypothetical protein